MLKVVVGGQFGSEAKGAVTAALCNEAVRDGHDVHVVRVGGPNAGHTAYDPDGNKWALRQVPAGMVVHPEVQGYIADGSEVEPAVLVDEIDRLEAAGHKIRERLTISGEATVIGQEHKRREQALVGAIGSTGKGIGAARADRILRSAMRVSDFAAKGALDFGWRIEAANRIGPGLTGLARDRYSSVVVEGVQGYGLGLHAGYYPQCTSSDVRAIDSIAAAGISPWGLMPDLDLELHLVVRPYPIRVAGNSGPLSNETSWAELGLPEELTTVTQKVRRVGEFDIELVREAIAANGPGVLLAVSMMDQLPGATYDAGEIAEGRTVRGLTRDGVAWLHQLEAATGQSVRWYGTGPTLNDWRIFA